jgi:glycosyltransferase involved in cell wall biosynthesis
MRLRIVYRSYGGENKKNRPEYYSKRIALESLLRAREAVDADVVFLNDGPIPADRLAVMEAHGELVSLAGVGMRGSYMAALRTPDRFGWADDDLVWFSEDDYLYAPDAFVRLLDAARELPADYFALYGGTDAFPVAPGLEDVWRPRGWDPHVFGEAAGYRWQRILSTASTFGTRCGVLREDLSVFRQGLLPHLNQLRDHDTCVVLQGYEPHDWRVVAREAVGRSAGDLRARARTAAIAPFKAALNVRAHRRAARRRALYAAEPNLAAHMETAQIPPGRDWAEVARQTGEWARARGREIGGPAAPLGSGPRLLLVESSLRENGGLRVSLAHARRWQAAGAPTALDVLQDVADEPLATPDPALPLRFLAPRGKRFRTQWPAALARLAVHARRSDVVVCGSEIGFSLLLSYAAARLARRKFAVLVQADLDDAVAAWVSRPLQGPTRWVHRHADAAVCVADSLVDGVVANGLPHDRAHVVTNGVDVPGLRHRAGLPDLPTDGFPESGAARGPDELPVIVGQGRLSTHKDFPLLVRAHAAVRSAGLEHRLVVIGEGPERATLEALVDELGVRDSVSLPGFRAEPYAELARAGLFVLPSRSEGMPLVLQEALALGVPIVATRCSTGVELLLDGGALGEIVPVGDVDALATAIEKHLRDPEELRRRARGGPARASAFDADSSARGVLAVLSRLVER